MSFQPKPYYLYWEDFSEGLRLPSIRGENGCSLQPYTDYFDTFAEEFEEHAEQSAKSEIESRTYALTSLLRFFAESKPQRRIEDVSDAILKKFKSWALAEVRANPRSRRGSAQEDTVNIKLRKVYNFVYWCQRNFLLPIGTIGAHGCRIKSTLPSIDQEKNPSDFILKHDNKYPLCFKGTGKKNTLPGTGQHWASEDEVEKLEDDFWTSVSSVGYRNTMMLRILDVQAFRIGSATSLKCAQFSDDVFKSQKSNPNFEVRPLRQKNNMGRTYEIPFTLAHSIKAYIDDEAIGRAFIVNKLATKGKMVQTDDIFISVKEGTRLSATFWSSTFGDAFKRIGANKGAATHALRRGTSQRRANELIQSLIEAGLPITEEYVTTELMQFLGHGSRGAQAAYLRALRRRRAGTRVEELSAQLEAQKIEATNLRAAAEALRAEKAALKAERDSLLKANAALRKANGLAAKTIAEGKAFAAPTSPVAA